MAPISRRSALGGALALMASTISSRPGIAAPAAQLWQKWAANDSASRIVVDHQAWGIFLRRYLVEEPDGIYRLRYGDVSAADKQALDLYLEKMSNVQLQSLNPTEQFAYWINFYNALTVKTILDHYPVKSIRELHHWWDGTVAGKADRGRWRTGCAGRHRASNPATAF